MPEPSTQPELNRGDDAKPPESLGKLRTRLIVAAIAALAAAAGIVYWAASSSIPDGIPESEYRRAEHAYRELHGKAPKHVDTVMFLAELSLMENRPDLALRCFSEIPSEHPLYGPDARLQEGQLLAESGRAEEAEARLREFLRLTESDAQSNRKNRTAARDWLSFLLSAQLRFEERKTLLEEGNRNDECTLKDLNLLYFPHLVIWNSSSAREPLRKFLAQDPGNPVFQTAHARYLTWEGELETARERLQEIVARRPGDLAALAALLECHYRNGGHASMQEVLRGAPDYSAAEPWLLTRMRGEVAALSGRWQDAETYFQHVLEVEPTNPYCTMGLARVYGALQRTAEREEMLQRSLILAQIRLDLARVADDAPHAVRALAAKCEALGLTEAAQSYRRYADRPAPITLREGPYD